MSGNTHTSRPQLWLESLGDWAWPGRAPQAEVLPPAWVPALPPAFEYAFAGSAPARSLPSHARARRRRVLLAGLASAFLALCSGLALRGHLTLGDIPGTRPPNPRLSATPASDRVSAPAVPLPRLVQVGTQASAGSSIDRASFASAALDGRGSFLVYLPPGFGADPALRYPVLYLLHGRNGHAAAFLEIGIQHALDRLIAKRAIPPLIAVMIQDLSGLQNWRNTGRRHSESYVVEVQELIDRLLPTIATRAGRAVAGSSMGGFGAMHVALANPFRFAVVESWLGFFDGLESELRADAPVLSRLGLHAFLYGAEADPVAVPEENPQFAAQLRSVGADAEGIVYPGGHSLEKVREHLDTGLLFAGRSLLAAGRRERVEEARARWRSP
jgi:enterochelin esterase-like enzyme